MSDKIIEDLNEFLKTANLNSYEINAFTALFSSSDLLTAREISGKSNVPSGRIYEVLEDLNKKGMIEIIESRPKKFRPLPLNRAFYNLISFQTKENSRRITYLFDQAKVLEQSIYESNSFMKTEPTKIFWSTAFGFQSIVSLYKKHCNETQQELLLNYFFNKTTLKVLNYAHALYEPIKIALERGVKALFLWSFPYDERPLSEDQKVYNLKFMQNVVKKHEELFGISPRKYDIEMKFIHRRIPTYYDIFDKKRIIFKLLNPLKPYQVFSCMNVLDPKLAKELRKQFYNIWAFEANEINSGEI